MNKTSKRKVPFLQGSLDALCGVYCIVNVVNLIKPLSKPQSKVLFGEIVCQVDQQAMQLQNCLLEGLSLKVMKKLLHATLSGYAVVWHIPYAGKRNPSLNAFWLSMQAFLEEGGRRCILLRLTGTNDHWTVVKSISQQQLNLYDSDNLQRISRMHCSTEATAADKAHMLWPAQCIFIRSN